MWVEEIKSSILFSGGEGVDVVFCTKIPFFVALSMGKYLLENVETYVALQRIL
jgi:hypothetical protein